jgi:hypothetical protein
VKNLIYFFVLLQTLISCSDNYNSLKRENLYGNVKQITETTYEAEFKFGEAKKGILKNKKVLKYDESGNRTEKNEYDAEGNVGYKESYKYKNDKLIEDVTYHRNELWLKVNYKYNDKGYKILEKRYSVLTFLCGKRTFKYDDSGNKIEENRYNSKGILNTKIIFSFDKKGDNIEESIYNADGSLNFRRTYKYDDRGNKIETKGYNKDGVLEVTGTDDYDDNGNKIGRNLYGAEGELISSEIFKYDERQNLTFKSDENRIEKIKIEYQYEFDETGNWIKKIKVLNDNPIIIIQRVIKYY